MKKIITYYRTSTKKQVLSLEWQQAEAQRYVKANNGVLLAEYKEVETGTRKRKRIEIYKAIQHALNEKATLVVAKLDRLARDVEFVYSLYNSGVDFVCLDLPMADKQTIGLMAVLAESEAQRIRDRIKAAVQAKKARGEKWGNISNLKNQHIGVRNSVKVRQEKFKAINQNAINTIRDFRDDAGYTFAKIADKLNSYGWKTTRNNCFTPKQVELLYKRHCLAA